MDSDAIDRAIDEELEKMSLNLSDSDSDDTEPEEDFTESNEKLENDFPDPVFTYLEASRGRMKTLEHLILEDLDENDSSCNETSHQIDFENLLNEHGCSPKEDLMNLKERILSEIEEHVTDPDDANGCSLENMKPTALVNDETKCDAYKETEKQFIFEWRAMEERLRKEEDLRLAEQEAEREHHLNSVKEEEEKKKHRFEEFEEVLRTMSRMSSPEKREDDGDDHLEQLQLEEVKQLELIKQLEEQLEEEKRVFEETQQEERRRNEKRCCVAAIKLQAAFRGALVRQWSKKELCKRKEEERRRQKEEKERERRREKEERMRKELEEKKRRAVEEEKRQKEEQEKRRVEYERAKEQERHRLERERKLEEQRRQQEEAKKIENERKLKEEEEKRKRIDEERKEEEKRRAEEKERIRKENEERKKRMDEEKIEEEKRMAEKKERKRMKDEDRRKRMDEEGKEEEKRRVKEKEERKQAEESGQVQKERKTINEDGSKSDEMEMKMKDKRRKKEESIEEEMRNVDKEERKGEEDMRRKIQEPEEKNKKQVEIKKIMQEGKQIKLDEKNSNGGEEKVPTIKKEGEKTGKTVLTHPISSQVSTAPSHTSTLPTKTHLDGARLQYEIDGEKSETDARGRQWDSADSVEKCPQDSSSTCLPEGTELKRLTWMMNCVPWSKLSMQNKRRRVTASTRKREARRASMPTLPPLPVDTILRSGSWSSLKQVTTVTLEDLPGCNLSPLTECTSLQSLTLRRCGLQDLEALNHCSGLKHIDVQENSITYINLGSLDRLEVLLLGKNKLTSIHGLDGAVNLTVLQLSYNIISRISGLGSLKRLQRLSVDHNQLISTRGLSDAFTLLHLDCSYNHLTHVEGLEHCALLNTLDLRGNSLSEIPILKDHVLLRELYLDDNSISSLHGLDSCWLPLLHCLSVAQNNVTQLPLLDDLISLKTLDISHNCLSELKNIYLSLQGCTRLQELNISDNPVEQENNWRSSILAVKPNLVKLNGEQTGASVEPSVGPTQLWSFQALCQAHQEQLDSVLEKHSMEISMAPTVLDAQLLASNHSVELLRLAEQQRYAHEYGDSSVSDTATQEPAASSCIQDELNCDLAVNERTQQHEAEQDIQSQPGAHLPVNIHKAHLEHPKADITSECAGGCIKPAQQSGPCRRATEALSMDLKTMAAMVIQRRWRKYRRTGPSKPPEPPKSQGKLSPQRMVGSSGRRIEPLDEDCAATVIQAIWRGYALRRRLACALALAQVSEGDEAFEEVDMDEFIFDEEAMENDWMALHSEASMSGLPKYSEQLPKPPLPLPEMRKNTPELPWKTRQAFIGNEGGATTERSLSQEPNTRRPSPPSSLRLGAPSERSEKILKEWGINSDSTALLILKRAQKMKGRKQQQQRKLLDPAERLAMFRKSSKQPVPVESRKRYQAESRDEIKGAVGREEVSVGDASSGEPRQTQQPGTNQWLRTQAVQSQRSSAASERDHFLPEIDPEILNGGRVQLLAGTRYRESPDSAGRLWPDLTGFSSHRTYHAHVRRHSVDDAKKEVPSPKRVTSAPSRKERISFRDNPVQLSGGWGGGKKRARVNK